MSPRGTSHGPPSDPSAGSPSSGGPAPVDPSRPAAPAAPRGRARRVWGVLVPLAFTAALAVFVWRERDALAPLRDAPPAALALLAALVVAGHFLNATEFWVLYRAAGTRIGIGENWMVFTSGQLANHLPARVGTLYRFRYMKGVHELTHARNVAVHGANLAVTLAGAALVGLLGALGAHLFTDAGPHPLVYAVFGAAAVLAAAFALLPLPRSQSTGRAARLWREFRRGFEEIRGRPRAAAAVVALEALKYAVTAWRFQVAFALLAIHAPFWTFLVVAPAAAIAGFVGLTPAALGFRETFVAAAAAGMGIEVAGGVLGATVDRAVLFAVALVLGAVGLALTYPELRARTGGGATG